MWKRGGYVKEGGLCGRGGLCGSLREILYLESNYCVQWAIQIVN